MDRVGHFAAVGRTDHNYAIVQARILLTRILFPRTIMQ